MEYVYDSDDFQSYSRYVNGVKSNPRVLGMGVFEFCRDDSSFKVTGEIIEGEAVFSREFNKFSSIKRSDHLYWFGASSLLTEEIIMVCGARNASEEGCNLAYQCGRMLVDKGFVVGSGYARGIDLASHRGALEAGGGTLAFLPYGIARFKVRRELVDSFDPERFVAISELEPWQVFSVYAALRRNKLLASISSAVIVVEPGESGGTWYSAEKALEMGKPLFFLEGNRPEVIRKMEALGGIRLGLVNGEPDLEVVFISLQNYD